MKSAGCPEEMAWRDRDATGYRLATGRPGRVRGGSVEMGERSGGGAAAEPACARTALSAASRSEGGGGGGGSQAEERGKAGIGEERLALALKLARGDCAASRSCPDPAVPGGRATPPIQNHNLISASCPRRYCLGMYYLGIADHISDGQSMIINFAFVLTTVYLQVTYRTKPSNRRSSTGHVVITTVLQHVQRTKIDTKRENSDSPCECART